MTDLPRPSSPNRVSREIIAYLPLLTLPLVTLALSTWVIRRSLPTADPKQDPNTVLVEMASTKLRQPIVLLTRLSVGTPLRSMSQAGTVTDVFVEPGNHIATGDPVLEIDGVVRVALQTEQPLWRNLSLGDHGPDVRAIQQSLVDSGLLEKVDGMVATETMIAAQEHFLRSGGVGRPLEISMDWYVWSRPGGFHVDEVVVAVGDQVPPLGSPLATVRAVRGEAAVLETDGTPMTLDSSHDWQVILEGTDEALAVTIRDGTPLVQSDLLSAVPFGESGAATGWVELRHPLEVTRVPPGAVLLDPTGIPCVVRRGQSRTFESASIETVNAEPGTVTVIGGLSRGESVVVNPIGSELSVLCER